MNLVFHIPVLGHQRGDIVPAGRLDHVPADQLNALIDAGAITPEPAPIPSVEELTAFLASSREDDPVEVTDGV